MDIVITSQVPSGTQKNKSISGTTLVVSLFFLWAITANLLPILIPHLKKACRLNTLESSLIDSAYWIAYFVIAIPAGLVMKKFGYKRTIITGLFLAASGAFLFYPAAESRSFLFFLFALFVLAAGMTFLETSANPFIAVLGDPATSAQRLNFAQAFNGLGAFIASMFLGKLIIGKDVKTPKELDLLSPTALDHYYAVLFHKVKFPYILIGIVLVLVALLFVITKFPKHQTKDQPENIEEKRGLILRKPQLMWGIITQFFYVGAQVCVSSFFILYATSVAGMTEYEATNYLGLLLLGFMLGRYIGAFAMKYINAAKLLYLYAAINISLMLIIVFLGGKEAVWAFIGVEFFMSIMYPTIFSLSIKNLGDHTPIASSYMVMAIIGGAVFPPLLGYISDATGSIQFAYVVPLMCFIPIVYFGWQQMRTIQKSLRKSTVPILFTLMVLCFSFPGKAQHYEANWDSLDKRPVPEWFKDAKFGIFITWGIYSVPAYAPKGQYAEWYQYWLQTNAFNGAVAKYHKQVFGDKTYYDLAKDFKAELYNPDDWAQLIEKSGAKYVIPVAKHHDGFCWWPDGYTRKTWGFPWNAVDIGPKRDLLGDLFTALRKTSVKAGVYFSWYEWYNPIYKSDPEKFALQYAIPQAKELIEKYKPAVFWTDGDWNDSDTTWHSPEFLSWMYNESSVKKDIVTYDRYGKGIRFKHGSVYTPEYQPDMEFGDHYFEESRGIGFSYSYNKMEDAWDYNSPKILVLLLSDLVSRGGNLLLDIGPDGSGKIPAIMQERLLQMGNWLEKNGKAIYNTRKWIRACQWSEGERDYKPKRVKGDFKANGDFMLKLTVDPEPGYAVKECFFTTNPITKEIFAILPKWPDNNRFVLKAMKVKPETKIRLVETGELLKWKQEKGNLVLTFPAFDPNRHKSDYAYAISISDPSSSKK